MFIVEIQLPSGSQYFAKSAIVSPEGTQCDPRLMSLSEISMNANLDGTFENSGATITLNNTDNHFDHIMIDATDKYIKDVPVRIYESGSLAIIFDGSFDAIQSSPPTQFAFTASYRTDALDNEVNQKITSGNTYADCPPANLGKYGNLAYGKCDVTSQIRNGMLVARRISNTRRGVGIYAGRFPYLASWNQIDTLNSVYTPRGFKIFDKAWTGNTVCLLENTAIGAIIWWKSKMYDEIYFNCEFNLSGTPVDLVPPQITELLHIYSAGTATAQYNDLGWTGQPLAISDGTTCRELLKRLAESFDCIFAPSNQRAISMLSGNMLWVILDWPALAASASVIDTTHVNRATFKNWFDLGDISSSVKASWFYGHQDNQYYCSGDFSESTVWNNKAGELCMQGVASQTIASARISNWLKLHKNPRLYIEFEIKFSIAKNWQVGDAIKATFKDGYYHGTQQTLMILKKSINPDTEIVRVTCVDIGLIIAGW